MIEEIKGEIVQVTTKANRCGEYTDFPEYERYALEGEGEFYAELLERVNRRLLRGTEECSIKTILTYHH